MIYYDRIDVSEEIDVNETSTTKQCDIFHYWYFSNEGFKFQLDVCNGCHDLLIMSVSLYEAILTINGVDFCCIYRCIISGISKSETLNLLENADLTEKIGIL